jgi:uncharacterized linocin/CFP29 family protein
MSGSIHHQAAGGMVPAGTGAAPSGNQHLAPGGMSHDGTAPGTGHPGMVPGSMAAGGMTPGIAPAGLAPGGTSPGLAPGGMMHPSPATDGMAASMSHSATMSGMAAGAMAPDGGLHPGMAPGGLVQPGVAPGGAVHAGMATGAAVHPVMTPSGMIHPGMAAGMARAHPGMNHGRDTIGWSPEVWHRIDAAVREEITRARVGAKFLPTVHVPAKATTAPADAVSTLAVGAAAIPGVAPPGALNVDETATIRINEVWVEFVLTPAQVEEEAASVHGLQHQHHLNQHHLHHDTSHHHRHHHQQIHASTGITVATRAANILAQVEDLVLFQGQRAFALPAAAAAAVVAAGGAAPAPIPPIGGANSTVGYRFPTSDFGLLNLNNPDFPPAQIVPVNPRIANGPYQDRTVAAVAQAFAILQANGQYGPYALLLQTNPFADANSPLPTTLITPAEPIRHLMNAGFYGSGTLASAADAGLPLPPNVLYTGFVVSLGGNTMDLVRGKMTEDEDVIVRFEQKDVSGNYRFRVMQRFALRIKDISAAVLLQFLSVAVP